ncbi:MAG: hypothetical protein KC422_00940 [Trueperaceae bacterium]|nr:hypothetical protein [Trueperaceae bacterium]
MRRVILLLLLLCGSLAMAQWQGKQGSSVTLTIDYQGLNQPSTLTVITSPEVKGELLIDLHFRGPDEARLGKTLVRPLRNGELSFPYTFDQTGEWGVWMRYGTGIDTYQEYIRFTLAEGPRVRNYGGLFEGDLASSVPGFVQPLGFAIFGFLLLISLVTLIFTIRWVAHKKRLIQPV